MKKLIIKKGVKPTNKLYNKIGAFLTSALKITEDQYLNNYYDRYDILIKGRLNRENKRNNRKGKERSRKVRIKNTES